MADCCSNNNSSNNCAPDLEEHSSGCPPEQVSNGSLLETSLEIAGYSIYPFVTDWLDTAIGQVPQVATKLSWREHCGRWAVRWGIGRNHYRLTPGIYAVGHPNSESPLLVSANYKFSFDCLRASLAGENAWIMVIDTAGINVWCAAGKGTFGSDEIIQRCQTSGVHKLVKHRQIIVPQLGAPGIAAHKVKQGTGFQVIYGPVRAADIKAFLVAGMQATQEMRQVTFTTWERLILTPVEIVGQRKPIFYAMLLLFILSGIGADIFSFSAAWNRSIAAVAAGLVGILTGTVLTPILLPWLPTRAFASKGALLGVITASILALGPYQSAKFGGLLSLYLLVIAVSSYTAMNFTGASTFTSPSGVEKELRIAIPCQTLAIIFAGLLWIGAAF